MRRLAIDKWTLTFISNHNSMTFDQLELRWGPENDQLQLGQQIVLKTIQYVLHFDKKEKDAWGK